MKFNTYWASIGYGEEGSFKNGDDRSMCTGEWGLIGLDFPH